ncbi:VTT domain-containing protein [Enterococcus alishanensis]|uniref:VTT domain-containing protein n=1 Tax=Enterococcus alishanensis TaxID=1303817 RepID=A0ABS6TF50_9ENTE|nr:VTT domain-containing protein [Enterococcus alishanensis]MBV7391521.1 VTT domain-containing protein [Enterococcus alishanensis]
MALIDFILHIDAHMQMLVATYGLGIYPILFGIIFIETGVVVFPFLPGDSFLFAAGALTALGGSVLHLPYVILICIVAAILGDTMNYWLGHSLGVKALYHSPISRFIKEDKVREAENFFNERGKWTIFLGRFMPFVRTFVPFIAGSSKMHWPTFSFFNIFGAIVWGLAGTLAGYFLGNIPIVSQHFSLIMLMIVFVSLVPMVLPYLKQKNA